MLVQRESLVWYVMVWSGMLWFGLFLFSFVSCSLVCFVFLWFCLFFYGLVCFSLVFVCFSLVWSLVCFAFLWFSFIRLGLGCFGLFFFVFGLVWFSLLSTDTFFPSSATTSSLPRFMMYISFPTSPFRHTQSPGENTWKIYNEVWILKNPDFDRAFKQLHLSLNHTKSRHGRFV